MVIAVTAAVPRLRAQFMVANGRGRSCDLLWGPKIDLLYLSSRWYGARLEETANVRRNIEQHIVNWGFSISIPGESRAFRMSMPCAHAPLQRNPINTLYRL